MSQADIVILSVDDESENAALIRRVLRLRPEFRLLTAGSGFEGLQILSANSVDVVLVDHSMPEMTGVEFLERARQKGLTTPAVMVTAYPEAEPVQAAQKKSLVKCIVAKPWEADDLMLAIDFVLRMSDKSHAPIAQ